MTASGGPTSHARGAMWSVLSALAFSLASIVGKDLLKSLGPLSLLFWRFLVGSAFLWGALWVWRRRGGPDPLAVPKRKAVAVGLMYGLMVVTGFIALDHLDVSVYIVIVYLYPVLVMVGSSLLGHQVRPVMWIALAIVTAGVVLTVPELFGGVGHISGLGVGLTVLQAFLMAGYMIVSSRLMPAGTDGVVSAAWMLLGGLVFITPPALIQGITVPRTGHLIGEVALFALIPTVISNVCFFRAMRHMMPGVVAMIMTLEVALAILWSVLFLGESVRPVKMLGAAVVIGGVLIAQWVALREARVAAAADAALHSPLAV